MKLSHLLLSLSLLLLSWANAGAQLAPADDFFHSGAQFYISNNIPQAKQMVEMGRKLYPEDVKLKKLEELLNQQSQQQNQQDQQQQDKQDQSQQQKSDEQKDQPEQQKEEQSKQDEQKQDEEQKPAEQQKASPDKPKEEPQPDEEQPATAKQMTPEEAKRLLDAQKGNEQLLQWKPEQKPRDKRRPVRDW